MKNNKGKNQFGGMDCTAKLAMTGMLLRGALATKQSIFWNW